MARGGGEVGDILSFLIHGFLGIGGGGKKGLRRRRRKVSMNRDRRRV